MSNSLPTSIRDWDYTHLFGIEAQYYMENILNNKYIQIGHVLFSIVVNH
jgi:hypothetical protein